MIRAPAEPTPPRPRRDRLLLALAGLLVMGFVIAFAARPPVVISPADLDDGLFVQLGQSLASGRWLGHYNARILVKGIGFPVFLAIGNVSGLPYPLALGLFYAGCASFAATVFGRLTRSTATGVALLAALLLAPPVYYTQLIAAERDLFYAALTLALVAAATALASGCLGRPRGMALLTGLLGGWFWLTREEGVWLLPGLALLAAIPLVATRRFGSGPAAGEPPCRARLAAAGGALAIAAAMVVAVGLVNWAVYGRFVVNEIKDRPFQSAMKALEDASAPYHYRGVPVPAAARARIYAVSPAFASLKEPVLDGRWQANALQAGCRENPDFCHDFGGGWFMWNLRGSAAEQGQHQSAGKAAAFYTRLAGEVRAACADGRLTCGRWRVPLVPPMRPEELPDVARSLGRVLHVLTFGEPVYTGPIPSDLSAPTARSMVVFLNAPVVQGEVAPVRLTGWFVSDGARWFALKAPPPVRLIEFTRSDSRDLVAHFKDPRLTLQRFAITVECPSETPCPLKVTPDGGAPAHLDLNALDAGEHRIGGGTFYVDSIDGPAADVRGRLLKLRLSRAWIGFAAQLNPLYRALVVLGAGAYGALLVAGVARRRVSTRLVVCTALLAATGARLVILALIDALSFVAASFSYAIPGIVLLVLFSVVALRELLAEALAWRGARALAPAPTAASAP
jgi:hypothetical protein